MNREKVRMYVKRYCELRDVQFAAYELYARKHGLTAKELFVLDIIWFSEDGCLQSEICERLSATKQTVSAIVKKFWKAGYLSLTESETDRRNKIIRFTEAGTERLREIIPPAANAEIDAMAELEDEDIAELVRITTLFPFKCGRSLAISRSHNLGEGAPKGFRRPNSTTSLRRCCWGRESRGMLSSGRCGDHL